MPINTASLKTFASGDAAAADRAGGRKSFDRLLLHSTTRHAHPATYATQIAELAAAGADTAGKEPAGAGWPYSWFNALAAAAFSRR